MSGPVPACAGHTLWRPDRCSSGTPGSRMRRPYRAMADRRGHPRGPVPACAGHTVIFLSMLICVRTTVNLPDGLAEEAKQRAKATGRTFTSLVIEGLCQVLADPKEPSAVERLPVHGDPSNRPLIDIADREALAEVLDADGLL